MKRFLSCRSLSAIFLIVLFFDTTIVTSQAQTYCTTGLYDPTYGCSFNSAINDFSLANFNQSGTGCSGELADYTSSIINLARGESYLFNLTSTSNAANTPNEYVGIWMDFNNNGSFEDAGELLFSSASGGVFSGVLSIPVAAPLGSYRLRVRLKYSFDLTAFNLNNSCTFYSNGEAHDYTANIAAPPSCSGLSSIGVTNIKKFSATINWACNGCSGPFIVEYGPKGFTPGTGANAGVGGTVINAAASPINITGLTSATAYNVYVRRSCGSVDYSLNFGPLAFTTVYNACGTLQTISCGQTYSANITTGPGEFDYYPNTGIFPDGKELIYQFTPTQTGKYVLSVSNTNFYTANYFIKEAALGCDRYSWRNINNVYSAPSSTVIGTLTAGVTYYLLVEAQASFGTQQDFMINCASPFDPCATISAVNCASPANVNIPSGPGAYDILNNDGFSSNQGKERIFTYTAQANGKIQISLSANGSFNTAGVFIKSAAGGCNSSGWTALGVANLFAAWGSDGYNVTAGNTYYVMIDAYSLEGSSLIMEILCPSVWEPCNSITSIYCDQSVVAAIPAGLGKFDTTGIYCSFVPHPGKELIYSFTPVQTGFYTINITATEFKPVLYLLKEANSCGDEGWKCLGSAFFSTSLITPRLQAGTAYYLMLDASETAEQTTQTFVINCTVPADPCLSIATLSCGETIDINLPAGNGAFFPTGPFLSQVSGGTEKIIRFTAPTTGTYLLKTNAHIGGAMVVAIKSVSNGCNENNWKYIAQFYENKTVLIPEQLVAGAEYYLLFENAYITTDEVADNIEIICPTEDYDPCPTVTNISGCGVSITSTHQPGVGSFVPYSFAGGYSFFGTGIGGPAGKENLYQFTPAVTGRYVIRSTAGTGEVSFSIKVASSGCNNTNWTYIGNVGGNAGFYPSPIPIKLIAGTAYYILVDAIDITGASNTFEITCPEAYNPCDQIIQLNCGSGYITVPANAGFGNFFGPACGSVPSTAGKAVIYEFTAGENGFYKIETISFMLFKIYLKKSSLGCDETGWTCLGEVYNVSSLLTPDLVKGQKYMVMFVSPYETSQFDLLQFRLFCPVSCTIYADADEDGYGDPNRSFTECNGVPFGYSANKDDCNDANSNVYPGAVEICGNNVDDNCNGQVDEGCNLPKISITGISVAEGNSGTRNATFIVLLSKLINKPVTVQYQTSNNTAIAPGDYTQKSGILTFPANSLLQTITVQVKGDRLNETNEKFIVQLSNPVNATININNATCTIYNDDPVPFLRIYDVTTSESSQLASIKVDLSEESGQVVKVKYDTKDGSAKAPADYTAVTNGTIEFQPGQTSKLITIVIKQDAVNESTEKFEVKLKQSENATITRGTAEVRITNSAPVLTKNAPGTTSSADEERITVSPNPANQQLNVRPFVRTGSGKIHIQLIDQSGRVVRQWLNGYNAEGQLMSLPAGDIASGIYMIVITDGKNKRLQQKVVIQH